MPDHYNKKKKRPEEVAAKKIGKGFGQITTLLGRIQEFLGVDPEASKRFQKLKKKK